MKVTKQTQRKFSSFEYFDVDTTCSIESKRIVIIYRPPPPEGNQLNDALFFEEFGTLTVSCFPWQPANSGPLQLSYG